MIPKGTNKLSSKLIYKERKVYEDEYKNLSGEMGSIDLWYDYKKLFGRVNNCGIPVFLNERYLSEIGENIYVLDIVDEMYNNVKKEVSNAVLLNKINLDKTEIFPLTPKRGWSSFHTEFHSNMDQLYRIFLSNYLNSEIENRILNFHTFMNEFIIFYRNFNKTTFLNRSSFVLSNRISPLISGLSMEFSEDGFGDDEVKYNNYLNDPEFKFYKSVMNRNGFVIDKNAPWRVFLDVNSQIVKSKLDSKGMKNLDQFFDKYYFKAHLKDLESLSVYCHKIYDYYIANAKVITKSKVCQNSGEIITQTYERKRISFEELMQTYDVRFWINNYIKIRNIEKKEAFKDSEIKVILQNSIDLLTYKNLEECLNYIQKTFGRREIETYQFKPLTSDEGYDKL